MRCLDTGVAGAFVVEPTPHHDERGLFARTFSAETFEQLGLDRGVAECSVAFNPAAFTLRGLHVQRPPHEEAKLVRCTRGAAFDVVLDLRAGSPTYLRWHGVELTWENRLALYVPPGCAHGYLTLEPETELAYQMSVAHVPAAAAGVRWDDARFGIEWPASPVVIAPRDAAYPDYVPV
jgi:dTDP-4-dehydrorhamnose 3,5-epimerase